MEKNIQEDCLSILGELVEKTRLLWVCPYCDSHERNKSGQLKHWEHCLIVRASKVISNQMEGQQK